METISRIIKCPNCGAQIDPDISRCPYCGYINTEGAEKKFQSDLDEIKDDIEETKKEPAKALKKGFSGGARTILIVVCVLVLLAAVSALELAREMKDKPKMFLSAEEEAYASAYRAGAGKELAAAYDDNDIEKMAEIYDKAYSVDRVNLWGVEHYEAGYASSCYMKLRKCLTDIDNKVVNGKDPGGENGRELKGTDTDSRVWDRKEAEEITYYCFYFYYRAYGDDGAKLFDPIREDEIIPIITQRLGFSEEDMEAFRDRVAAGSGVNRSDVYKATKKYFGNYH